MDRCQTGEAFGEDAARARPIQTAEAAHLETQPDRPISDRQIGQRALVGAVDPGGLPQAERAARRPARGTDNEGQLLRRDDELTQTQAGQVGNESREVHGWKLLK